MVAVAVRPELLPEAYRVLDAEVPFACALCGWNGENSLWPVRVASPVVCERDRAAIRHVSSLGDCWLCSRCRAESFKQLSRER